MPVILWDDGSAVRDSAAAWREVADGAAPARPAARHAGGGDPRSGVKRCPTNPNSPKLADPRRCRPIRRCRARARDLEAVYDIPVTVSAVLGKATMQVSQLLKLGRGAVVELDRKLGEAIDIYVNNRLVARGEVVMVDDNRLGVTMTEIVKADRAKHPDPPLARRHRPHAGEGRGGSACAC